jgi:predicted permease
VLPLAILYNVIIPILLIVGLGVLVERLFRPNPRALSTAAFYVFVPALVLSGLAHTDVQSGEIGLILLLEIGLSLILAVVGWIVARSMQYDRQLESAFMLTVAFINAGNYGLAVNEFAFGEAGLQRALIFFIGTGITGNTLGVFLASRGTASIRRSLLNVLLVPLPYAMLIGLAINLGYASLPVPLDRAITLLGQAAVPVMLFTLGLQLSRTSFKGKLKPILLATMTRLILSPLIALPLVLLFGLSGLSRQTTLVQAAMPTAVTTTILAAEFGSDIEFTSAVVLISTLVSVVTLTIILTLVM